MSTAIGTMANTINAAGMMGGKGELAWYSEFPEQR
jgi:hypothetical protein